MHSWRLGTVAVGVPLALAVVGCESSPVPSPSRPDAAPPDAGPPDDGCPAGELDQPDGSCRPAGIGPTECGEGFEHDGKDSCREVLPRAACPTGTMAIPGETMCREIAPCATGKWGGIPVDALTQYVDASYAGGDGDGSAAKPWTTVQEAIDAAEPGAVVAIAAGSYVEHVLVKGKPVRLWGTCPTDVEIVGPEGSLFVIDVRTGADGTEVHDLATTGGGVGFAVSGSKDVIGDRLWIHDLTDPGWMAKNTLGATSVTLRRSLVDAAGDLGVYGVGAEMTLEESVVRETATNENKAFGHGINVSIDSTSKAPATLVVRRSLVEDTHEGAIHVNGSPALVEDSVIRNTLPSEQDASGGAGIWVWRDEITGGRGSLTMRRSVVAHSSAYGVSAMDSDLDLDAVVVRDTAAQASDHSGGIGVIALDTIVEPGGQSTVGVRRSVVERARGAGVGVAGVVATIESVVSRDIDLEASDGKAGRGITVENNPFVTPTLAGTGTVRGCRVERTHETGVSFVGATGTVESTLVTDIAPRADGFFGRGIAIEMDLTTAPSDLTIDRVEVQRAHEFGIFVVGSQATIDRAVVTDTLARVADGSGGVGLAVQFSVETGATAYASITRTRIEASRQSGVSVIGATADLNHVEIHDSRTDDSGAFGDGITVSAGYFHAVLVPTEAHVRTSVIDGSARAGISTFSSKVSIADTQLECNPIQLDGEAVEGVAYELTDMGGNSCGCAGASETCTVLSSNLTPPTPVSN